MCYFRKNPQKSLGAAPTCKMSMARTSANYIGPFSTNSLISMLDTSVYCILHKNLDRCKTKNMYILNKYSYHIPMNVLGPTESTGIYNHKHSYELLLYV
jgi:hypothetical protein